LVLSCFFYFFLRKSHCFWLFCCCFSIQFPWTQYFFIIYSLFSQISRERKRAFWSHHFVNVALVCLFVLVLYAFLALKERFLFFTSKESCVFVAFWKLTMNEGKRKNGNDFFYLFCLRLELKEKWAFPVAGICMYLFVDMSYFPTIW
jgi:hypothetical protein